MVTDKVIKLVAQLIEKTRKLSITWEPTAKQDEFLSVLGGSVSFTLGPGHETDIILTMRDELDRVLLTIDSEEIAQVSELYAEARLQALNVDESLDSVLDQLARME
jgi:hypothetical protein